MTGDLRLSAVYYILIKFFLCSCSCDFAMLVRTIPFKQIELYHIYINFPCNIIYAEQSRFKILNIYSVIMMSLPYLPHPNIKIFIIQLLLRLTCIWTVGYDCSCTFQTCTFPSVPPETNHLPSIDKSILIFWLVFTSLGKQNIGRPGTYN